MALFRRRESRATRAAGAAGAARAAGTGNSTGTGASDGATDRVETLLLEAMRDKESITVDEAMQVPCFASCVSFVSYAVASLPIKLYRENGAATEEVTGDVRIRLLNDESGDLPDSFQIKQATVTDYLIHGGGYIYIAKKQGKWDGLYYVDARDVSWVKNTDPIFKDADYYIGGNRYRHWDILALLRKTRDGVSGHGLFEEGREALSTAYNMQVFQHSLVSGGGNKNGFLQTRSKVTEPVLNEIRSRWRSFRTNTNKEPLILNDGLEFKEISATSVEMQLNENIRTLDDEICLLFGLSPKVISGAVDADGFAAAVKTAVLPVLEAFQCALNRCLLLESEKGRMYFAFDTSELLKGDMLRRYQAYQTALQSNFMQIDEVRYKEDLSPIGFNYVKLALSDVLLDVKNGTVYTPNTNQTARIDDVKTPVDKSEENGIINISEERYNPYHDERGRFASGGGGGIQRKVTAEDNGKIILEEKIRNGEITLDLFQVKQEPHMEGTREEGKSYFTIEFDELQQLVYEKHRTGKIRVTDSQIKETITADKYIGFEIDPITKEKSPTNRFTVHYSKNRTHAVPTRER